ncbi:MAG: HesA/MoeB/ThiF family protein [Candidatus Heimdallarchaeaceae archaeon]
MKYEDRYSRLKSLKDFGYEVDWEVLFEKTLLIIGIGGVGSLVAEILTRCGVGKIILIDLDYVEAVNLNRLFYKNEHIGQTKVEAAKEILSTVNPNVKILPIFEDICNTNFETKFEQLIKESDLIFSCLDNLPARLYINEKSVKLNRPYIDTGATRSGLGGYVHLVVPRKTACYACTGSIDLGKDEKGESCTASLPTTIAIIASLASEIGLKYILNFGVVPDYIGFNALTDQFIIQKMKRDDNCYICGEKRYTETQKEEKMRDLKAMTKGKDLSNILDELESLEDKNE